MLKKPTGNRLSWSYFPSMKRALTCYTVVGGLTYMKNPISRISYLKFVISTTFSLLSYLLWKQAISGRARAVAAALCRDYTLLQPYLSTCAVES